MSGLNHFMKAGLMKGYAQSKGVPAPGVLVPLTGLMILLGGLGVLLGVYVELSVALIAVFLFFVSFKMHNYWSDQDPQMKMSNQTNFMKNMALLGAALAFLSVPQPWIYSLF